MSRPVAALAALLFTLCVVGPARAAPDHAGALREFRSGQAALRAGDAGRAVAHLDRAEALLGAPNLRLQPLLLQALFAAGDYRRYLEEHRTLLELKPDPGLAFLAELEGMRRKAQEVVGAEDGRRAAEAKAWAAVEGPCAQSLAAPEDEALDRCAAAAEAYRKAWKDAPPEPW